MSMVYGLCNAMVYGELGVYPLHITAFSRMVTFWARLLNGPQDKLSVKSYRLVYCILIINLCLLFPPPGWLVVVIAGGTPAILIYI